MKEVYILQRESSSLQNSAELLLSPKTLPLSYSTTGASIPFLYPQSPNFPFFPGSVLVCPDLDPPQSTLNTVFKSLSFYSFSPGSQGNSLRPYKTHPNRVYRESTHTTVHEREEGGRICLPGSLQVPFLIGQNVPHRCYLPTLLDCIFWPLEQLCGKPDTTF